VTSRAAILAALALGLTSACDGGAEPAPPAAPEVDEQAYRQAVSEFETHYSRGAFEDALSAGRRALHYAPSRAEPYAALSRVYSQTGRDEQAAEFFAAVAAQYPDSPYAWDSKGSHEFQLHRWEPARDSFTRAAELGPDEPGPHFNLGTVLHHLGDFEGAERAFRRAYELEPELPTTGARLGRALRVLGRYEEAERVVHEALARKPDAAELHYALAQLQLRAGRDSDAESSLRRAVELDPRSEASQSALAGLLQRTGRPDEALVFSAVGERLRRVTRYRDFLLERLRLIPSEPLVPVQLAELELSEGNIGAALRWLTRSRALGASAERVAAGLARAALLAGDSARGRAALVEMGDWQEPHGDLARATSLVVGGEPEAARAMIDRALAHEPDKILLHAAADLYGAAGAPDRALAALVRAQNVPFPPAPLPAGSDR
jgi:tetratricopeptide (TPR) repeat protein